ncbi:MAG: divergent PAP2 family protein [Erysipelotrichaceae bacterium]|nr:divergent PAP2 family protein [Erysipelotrichaceae bacterium]
MLKLYPFWAAFAAWCVAQAIKPFVYYIKNKKWSWYVILASGGWPSSHSATSIALANSVGMQEGYSSTFFAIALTVALITIYDAANVRFYAGQNIMVTKQLIHDVQVITGEHLDDPIYQTKMKETLGHKWNEVFGGIILGFVVSYLFYMFK